MDLVKIKAFDGVIISLPKQLVASSECLKSLLELFADNEECIPLFNWSTTSEIISLMNDWWMKNNNFHLVKTETLVQLTIAANYLLIPALEDFCLQQLISRIITEEDHDWFPFAFETTKISNYLNFPAIAKLRNDYPQLDDFKIPCERIYKCQRLRDMIPVSELSYPDTQEIEILDDYGLTSCSVLNFEGIEVFSNLKYIDCRKSIILDTKPLTLLKKLQHLFLKWCVPNPSLLEIESLRSLNIVNYPFSDLKSRNPEFGEPNVYRELVEACREYRLDYDQFLNVKFTGFEKVQQLVSLSIQGTHLKDLNFMLENPPPNLELVDLQENEITTGLDKLRNIKSLTKLDLSDNDLHNIDGIEYLTNLEHLNLNCNGMLRDIQPLQHLKRLHQLDISFTDISNLEPLKNLKNLKFLDASGINAPNYSHIKHVPHLIKLIFP